MPPLPSHLDPWHPTTCLRMRAGLQHQLASTRRQVDGPVWSVTLDHPSHPTLNSRHHLQLAGTVFVHEALAYRPNSDLPISYDAALSPSTIMSRDIGVTRLTTCLGQQAISMRTECIVLESRELGRNITVRPGTVVDASSPCLNWTSDLPDLSSPHLDCHPPITVHNVLLAIHRAVSAPLSYHDLDVLDPPTQDAVITAWHNRCLAQDDMKRLDILAAAGVGTHVAGLSATSRGAQVWNLHLV